jgi:signal transduction histidine kinase
MQQEGWEELERIKERARQLRRDMGRASARGERAARRERGRRWRELSPQERALREAHRRAERKVHFVRHLVTFVFVILFLAVVAGRAALIVAFGWGIGLGAHFFSAVVAPRLRRRWIESEVDRQVGKRVHRERRSLEEEQLRSLEELSASIAHEIRNPITAAKSLVQQMGEDPGSPEQVEYAKVALEELDRVERSISHLLRYAREEDMQPRTMRMAEVVEGALETLRERISTAGVVLGTEIASEGEMEGDPEKLRRVVINLVSNAVDSLEEAGRTERHVRVAVGENAAKSEVWLRVADNGPGIDAETQRKMFRPFFTSKANGTGLGLAISKKLVDAHRGTIEVQSVPGEGAEFVLTFPKQLDLAAAR